MEGKRLIIKRRVPRGRQQLVIVFLGGLLVIGLVFVVQLKTTLSARTLAKVGSDVANMREEFGSLGAEPTSASSEATSSAEATTADDLATLKTYMEAAMKAEATSADTSAPTETSTTPVTEVPDSTSTTPTTTP